MTNWRERAKNIIKALDDWVKETETLESAVDQTVNNNLFTWNDIQFSLDHIRSSTTNNHLIEWGIKSALDYLQITDKTVLCLHAGNLPLVGFQDVIAVLLSGYKYAGKISRKDPYLLPGFLKKLKLNGFENDIQYTLNLGDYEGLQADAVMFSGSGESAKQVKNRIFREGIVAKNSKCLIRIASFSMVYLDRHDDSSLSELAEAMLRYEGKGCRSVALVVSPFDPEVMINQIGLHLEEFWNKNPPLKTLSPKTRYRLAYNEAVGKKQDLFRHILVQQNGLELDNDDIIYWVKGNNYKAEKLAESNLMRLQNIYTVNPRITINGFEDRIAPLSSAQKPPISWEPDGIDPLHWLVKGHSN